MKTEFDGELQSTIAEQPNDILKCAMHLFPGYLHGATQFALSYGGGGSNIWQVGHLG